MNVFVIPSWYPTSQCSHTGIFIKEQSVLLARHFSKCNVGISTWGGNEESLHLSRKEFYKIPFRLLRKHKGSKKTLLPNCNEYYTPALTWTRKVLNGNINRIIKANEQNLNSFQSEFGKADIIHAHAAHPAGYIAMKLSEKYNIPFVLTEHMTPFPFETFLKNGEISRYISEPIRKANEVICVSQYLKESISSLLKIESIVLNNFIDSDFFTPKENQRTSNQSLKLLFIGRLVHQKGVDILLKAMKILQEKEQMRIELRIGGSGDDANRYHNLSSNLGLKNAHWLGELNREEVRNELQACDVFALPSRHENNPVVLLEALACGIPIIVTSCGGPEELANEKNGLVAEPENVPALVMKISEFQANRKRWSSQEIRTNFMNRYSSEISCNRLQSIYRQLINTK
ncbi:MAG: glycosyltransferase family 4 protein [Cyclobacteriaceae bacterium]